MPHFRHYDTQEHLREHYEAYMEQIRKDEQYETSDEDYVVNHTGSGVPLCKLVHVTDIPYLDGGFAAVNWHPEMNQFIICEPGEQDWFIDRTEESLRAFAKIIAFNPKEWGCHRCGCSAEMKDNERICWCDACQNDGCCTPTMMMCDTFAPSRAKSQYFKKRWSLPPPLVIPLERQTALGSGMFEPKPVSPSKNAKVIMEDHERDEWFYNVEERRKMVFRN